MPNHSLTYQLLAEILRSLEAEGNSFGVDRHLRWQQLLASLPDDLPVEKLRDLFCPIFAKNEPEQALFYHIFDQSMERVKAVHEAYSPPVPPIVKEEKKWKRRILWLAALLLLLAAFPVYQWWESLQAPDEMSIPKTVEPGSTLIICPDSMRLEKFGKITAASFCKGNASTLETALGTYTLAPNGCLQMTAKDTTGQDSVCVSAQNAGGRAIRLLFIPTIERQEFAEIKKDSAATAGPRFVKKALPHPESDLAKLKIDPPPAWVLSLIKYQWLFKTAFLLALAALLWTLLRWRENRRRKLIAELESKTKPPYVWNIRIDDLEPPEMNEAYFSALNRLRRRTGDEHFYLDIPATIGATIEKAGYAEFRYGQHTRPPEYLLLIDRQSAANHRAQVFDNLYRAFRDNEVLLERFFFEGDIRQCHNEAFPDGIALQELQHKYPSSRLLVVGNGYQLLSPLSGKLSKWTDIFTQWKQRSLLSPMPTGGWGRREEHLRELFAVLPASLQGLNFLIEQLDAGDDADFSTWREKVSDAPAEPVELQGGLLATLRSYFSEELLQWIAACAVYPSLHYDLTRYLGALLSTPSRNLVTVGNLLELTRLPWFVEGKIPQEARAVLLDYLEREHPGMLLDVREGLHLLLLKNQPPKDSLAYEDFRMTAALNEWLFAKDAKRKKELEQEIAALLETGVEADFTVIKYLDRERSPLDFVVPDAWKKYVYKGGQRGLGFREMWKDLFYWALPLWLLLAGFALWWQPPVEECQGELVTYKGMTLCIETALDRLIYLEHLGRDTIEAGDLPGLDSVDYRALQILSKRPTDPTDSTLLTPFDSTFIRYRENLAIALYNKGASFGESGRLDEAAWRAAGCPFFTKTLNFDTSDYDVRRALAWCAEKPEPTLNIPDRASGKVTNAANGSPLQGVSITGGGFALTSAKDGTFALDLKAAGFRQSGIRLVFQKDGFLTFSKDFPLEGSAGLGTVALTPVLPEQPNNSLSINGLVLEDGSNKPIAGVKVTSDYANALTDPAGKFRLQFTPDQDYPGKLNIRLEKADYEPGGQFVLTGKPIVETTLYLQPSDSGASTAGGGTVTSNPDSSAKIPIPILIKVPGGTFTMGCTPEQDGDCQDDEKPAHEVKVSSFEIGKYEVTVSQYLAFADATKGNYPEWLEPDNDYHVETGSDSYYKNKGYSRQAVNLPVVGVSWDNAVAYSKWLSEKTGQTWRLPTEAEWEFAARGGTKSKGFKYSGSNDLDEVGWYSTNSGSRPHEVGGKKENELGIKDMSGNVWEWCSDWYDEKYYEKSPAENPPGAIYGSSRVGRGGSWYYDAVGARCAYRSGDRADDRDDNLGFRLSRTD